MKVCSSYHFLVLAVLLLSCNSKSIKKDERICNCIELEQILVDTIFLTKLKTEDFFYTGKCKFQKEDGSTLTNKYLNGHLIEIIGNNPNKTISEELYYDTIGNLIKRVIH